MNNLTYSLIIKQIIKINLLSFKKLIVIQLNKISKKAKKNLAKFKIYMLIAYSTLIFRMNKNRKIINCLIFNIIKITI
jgi:hypothetical protein